MIFLFLLLTIHNSATISAVAGGSDNFLIFLAALVQFTSAQLCTCGSVTSAKGSVPVCRRWPDNHSLAMQCKEFHCPRFATLMTFLLNSTLPLYYWPALGALYVLLICTWVSPLLCALSTKTCTMVPCTETCTQCPVQLTCTWVPCTKTYTLVPCTKTSTWVPFLLRLALRKWWFFLTLQMITHHCHGQLHYKSPV